jgi:hypothetical protein
VSASAEPPPTAQAPWYEKAFKIQMFLLLAAGAIWGPIITFSHPLVVPRFPWVVLVIKIGMATIVPIGGGFFAILLFRHLLWLFGRGPNVPTWIGPPSRVNCVMMMFAGLVFAGIGIEMWRPVASSLTLLGSSIWFFFSLTGFLWAQREARKSCRKDAI